jgi:hypothetical protein
MNEFITFIRTWLGERSTWIGIFALLAAFNIDPLTDIQREAIIVVGISLVARHEQKSIR